MASIESRVRRARDRAIPAAREANRRAKARAAESAIRIAGQLCGCSLIRLEYPPSAENVPRYGHGKPAHTKLRQLCDARETAVRTTLTTLHRYVDDLRGVETHADDPLEPSWVNGWLPALDSAAIYSFLRERRPSLYVEIGSGN